jgi:tetratricopeptide (TPR) repeat protein
VRSLESAITQYPRELHLRLVAAELLRNAGMAERALDLLEEGIRRAPDSAAFLTSKGALLTDLDRIEEALTYLRAARLRSPDSLAARRNLIPALLRSGAAAEVLGLCDELMERAPDDQLTIAWRATALRQLADPAYARLYDYPRLVRSYLLRPAPPYADLAQFNAAFAQTLTGLHRHSQHPLAQSLRGGTQTERNLPRDHPVVAAFFAMLDAPIRDYLSALDAGDRQHPTDRRMRDGYRITGSWSVQLRPGGFHTNHVHPRGWLSSAYYVELPGGADDGERAGWIKFGEPGMSQPVCPPDHFVKPEPGMLVLFPSHMWHGTVPFERGDRRLTAAFDVLPA